MQYPDNHPNAKIMIFLHMNVKKYTEDGMINPIEKAGHGNYLAFRIVP